MKENLRTFLKEEYENRLGRNPSYSLRSFAYTLRMNTGTLSAMMSGKRKITRKALESICDRLGVSPMKKKRLIEIIEKHQYAKGLLNKPLKLNDGIDEERQRLEHETFKAISEWHHWAILQLVRIDEYGTNPEHSTPRWFARRLGLNELHVKIALERLVELELLKIVDGFYIRTAEKLTTKDRKVTTPALRQWQRSLREKAVASLENDPIEIRSMTSSTMAIDRTRLDEARVIIEEFQERLSAFLEDGKKENVYQLTVSLFPLENLEGL